MPAKFIFSKFIIVTISLLFFNFSHAVPGLDPNDFSEERLLDLEECLESIDKRTINSLISKGIEMRKEVLKVCKDEGYDEAEDLAQEYKIELNDIDGIEIINECGEGSEVLLQQIPLATYSEESKEHDDPKHICNMKKYNF